ncbi:hypothetical protein CABS01_16674 [Colletotrichum abscissum]|uniref:Uncharacterized protein n=1 Tax=Colletotrichum abscissum TaxID=1671311 RepID=A0A9Q0ATH7_9PEZI|nr:uncharacterized protein CABS01_16674 [Colletotrichum abscissum]KAI3530628.1 hypothetical protein CABS02_14431 [Colletotrichum abscissum]KAK1517385.1 hypothetical protein CABS01_16674 [Colletotrichum abscissum]
MTALLRAAPTDSIFEQRDPMERSHTLDPDGDVVLVLEDTNPAFALWDKCTTAGLQELNRWRAHKTHISLVEFDFGIQGRTKSRRQLQEIEQKGQEKEEEARRVEVSNGVLGSISAKPADFERASPRATVSFHRAGPTSADKTAVELFASVTHDQHQLSASSAPLHLL